MFIDPSGYFIQIIIGAFVGAIIGVIGSYIVQKGNSENLNIKKLIIAAIAGAVSGGLATSLVALPGQIAAKYYISQTKTEAFKSVRKATPRMLRSNASNLVINQTIRVY